MADPMKLIHALSSASARSDTFGLDEYLELLNFAGNNYAVNLRQSLGTTHEEIGSDFMGLVEGAYQRNGIVFACMMVRQLLFQEARFQFRRLQSGRPGEYFGTTDLQPLEKPGNGQTTGDLLARMMQDVDLAGNWYGALEGVGSSRRISRLHPQYVTIVLGSKRDVANPSTAPDVETVGYIYKAPDDEAVTYLPEQVAHFAPYPDPTANFRGMSWLTPVVREVMADQAATTHKLKFFEQGATPNMVVKFDPSQEKEKVEAWIKLMEGQLGGAANAYRTLFLGGGADATVIGANMRDAGLKEVQGAGETRIAAAAGVPPIIAGFSEGLAAATYSNYGQARRRFADGTMRPLWRNAAGSLERIIRTPPRARLWYDDRDVPFLQEDLKDAADIQKVDAEAIKGLTEAGYEPESVVDAITAGDLKRLQHSGMFSVQLHPPGGDEAEGEGEESAPPARARIQVRAAKGGGDLSPAGEAEIRGIVERFESVDAEIRSLLAEAVTGDREALKRRALAELDGLRAERVEDAIHAAYEAAYESATAEIEALPRQNANAETLAESMQKKLADGIAEAEGRTEDAFETVNGENLVEKSQDAVTALVDEAERRWTLGAYAAMLGYTLGRRATSRGIKDAAAGGQVRISSHGSKDPICGPLEGKVFPAISAPEPPFHESCSHMLEPLG